MYFEFSLMHGLELNMNGLRVHIIYFVDKMATLNTLICMFQKYRNYYKHCYNICTGYVAV